MHQCRLISCNECPTLVEDAENGGGYVCMAQEGVCEISVPSSQFYYERKPALKE